jgi:hypothetical protein
MKNILPFIVGIIVMTAITEYDRNRSNKYFIETTIKYQKQADELLKKFK